MSTSKEMPTKDLKITYEQALQIAMIAAQMSWCDKREQRGEMADKIAGILADAPELP